jgi:hypothetical protein
MDRAWRWVATRAIRLNTHSCRADYPGDVRRVLLSVVLAVRCPRSSATSASNAATVSERAALSRYSGLARSAISTDAMARPPAPSGPVVRRRSASSRRSSRFARTSARRIIADGRLRGSHWRSASSTAPRSEHASRARVLAEPSRPTRRLNSSLSMGSAPAASSRSRAAARHDVTTRSQRLPSTKPREPRARRRLGSRGRERMRPGLIGAQPPWTDGTAGGSRRDHAAQNCSRDALRCTFAARWPGALV